MSEKIGGSGKRLCLAAAVLLAATGCAGSAGSRSGDGTGTGPSVPVAQSSGGGLVAAGGTAYGGDPSAAVADLRLIRESGERVANGRVSPGDRAKMCFDVNRNGYVSMWLLDAEKNLSRIVPNEFMPGAGNGVKVSGGNEYCVTGSGMTENNKQMGASQEEWLFRVREPYGRAEVFLYWTGTLDQQVAEDNFVDVDALGRAITQSLRPKTGDSSEDRLRGGGLTIFYRVVERGE